jgi:Flp pilus assembly pilin Flp
MPRKHSTESGQASVELAALLPLIAVVLAACWQALLAAHTLWSASGAARAAARAAAIGGDVKEAAEAALPRSLERHARISVTGRGEVTVRLRIPRVLPGLELGTVTAHGRYAAQK